MIDFFTSSSRRSRRIAEALSPLSSQASRLPGTDHFPEFATRSKDHHDLLHTGFLVITMAVANFKTTLLSGGTVGGVSASMQFPREQKEYVFRPLVSSYTSIFGTQWESRLVSLRRFS